MVVVVVVVVVVVSRPHKRHTPIRRLRPDRFSSTFFFVLVKFFFGSSAECGSVKLISLEDSRSVHIFSCFFFGLVHGALFCSSSEYTVRWVKFTLEK